MSTTGLEAASSFSWLLRQCRELSLTPDELDVLMGKVIQRRCIFHLNPAYTKKLAVQLGADASAWSQAMGLDLLGDLSSRGVFVQALRYCPQCLAKGWHTILFQHAAVTSCPIHNATLRVGCPNCGRAHDTSPRGILENHLYCASCAQLASSATMELYVPEEWRHAFIGLREALSTKTARHIERSWHYSDRSADEIAASTEEARAMSIHAFNGSRMCPFLRRCKEFDVRIESEYCPRGEQRNKVLLVAAGQALNAIQQLLNAGGCKEIPGYISATLGDSGSQRTLGPTSVPRIALWRTAASLGLKRTLWGQFPLLRRGYEFDRLLPKNGEAASFVTIFQVYSLFVWNLMELRSMSHSEDVSWLKIPSAPVFSPAWTVLRKGDAIYLWMRSRCDLASIQRLTRRYATAYTID